MRPGGMFDKILEGGMTVLALGLVAFVALIVFLFVGGIVAIWTGSIALGAAIGMVVTFGVGWILYQIGKHV